jgi:alkylhydroperoxidase family enzyme
MAPISAALRATLGFLEKLALQPDAVSPEDVAPMRAAGVSNEGIEEAIAVCTVFNVAIRVADTFDLEPLMPEQAEQFGKMRLERGYTL